MDNIISILSIYFFVAIGYIAKMNLKKDLDEKSIVKLNIYFLLPILAFWGLLTQKINIEIIKTPFIYIAICLIALGFSTIVAKRFFIDSKDRSIVAMASVTGITGSIGIPLGLAMFSKIIHHIYEPHQHNEYVFCLYNRGLYIFKR